MKFFTVFSCLVAVAVASPSWTLRGLTDAVENPTTDPALKPVLVNALNVVMDKLFAGEDISGFTVITEAGPIGTFDLLELEYALNNAGPLMKPYIINAVNQFMDDLAAGLPMGPVSPQLPALELSYWSLQDLEEAMTSPATNPVLIPYLEQAVNDLLWAMFHGQIAEHTGHNIVVAIPIDVVAAAAPVVPVVPTPGAISGPTAPAPVAPVEPTEPVAPVAPAVSASSPLVQIILNVQTPEVVDVVAPVAKPVNPRPRPTPEATINPIDLAPLPVESLPLAPVAAVGPMV